MSKSGSIISAESEVIPYRVYYRHSQTVVELKFTDYKLRVEELIAKCIEELSDQYMIKLNGNYLHYALYPATKAGTKSEDALEISHGQKIKGVGIKRFYLEYLNLSKESIST